MTHITLLATAVVVLLFGIMVLFSLLVPVHA